MLISGSLSLLNLKYSSLEIGREVLQGGLSSLVLGNTVFTLVTLSLVRTIIRVTTNKYWHPQHLEKFYTKH